jgi:uncharacterized membrane protein YoaK (UPF0700 family)
VDWIVEGTSPSCPAFEGGLLYPTQYREVEGPDAMADPITSKGSASTKPSTARSELAFGQDVIRALPFLFSVIAGATDIIGFLCLNGLFTAHITGNLVVLAARIIAGDPTIISTMLSVPIFVLVLLLTSLMARAIERAGGSSLRLLTLLQLLLLLSFLSLGVAEGPWSDADAPFAIVAGMLGVAAMATQNVMVQAGLINTPTTAVMTTNVTHLMVDFSAVLLSRDATEVATAKSRALHTLPVVVGFILGCAVGAAGEAAGGLWALGLPTAIAFFALHRLSARHG